MKNKIFTLSRLAVEIAVLTLTLFAFYKKIYPVKIFDLQFVAMLQSGIMTGAAVSILLFVLIFVLTFVFGRVYCSILCPLGIFQEILTFVFRLLHVRFGGLCCLRFMSMKKGLSGLLS